MKKIIILFKNWLFNIRKKKAIKDSNANYIRPFKAFAC